MAVETFLQPKSIVVVGETAAQYAPHEQETPDMTVRVDAGRVFDTVTRTVTDVVAQSTATVAAPAVNPRNDIVYVDNVTGVVGVATGVEAASPVDPAIPDAKSPIARVNLTTGTVTITNADLDDLRVSSIGIAGGSAPIPRSPGPADNTMLNRLEIAQQHALTAGNLVDGMFDVFADELGVDAVASLNATYNAGAFSYTNDPTGVFGADLATQGGAIASSELAGSWQKELAFDDNNTTRWAHDGATLGPDATGQYIGQDFGVGNAPNIRRVSFSQHTPTGNHIFGPDSIAVDYSDNGSAWTQVDTVSPINNGTIQSFDIADGGAHRWWRIRALQDTNNTNAAWSVFELQMNEPAPATDLTLQSNAFTAQNQPDSVAATILWEEIDPVTLNTDLLVDISRDGGTTFTTGTLVDQGIYATPKKMLTATIDVSGQPAGTAMKWRIRTANLKSLRVHGAGLTWG